MEPTTQSSVPFWARIKKIATPALMVVGGFVLIVLAFTMVVSLYSNTSLTSISYDSYSSNQIAPGVPMYDETTSRGVGGGHASNEVALDYYPSPIPPSTGYVPGLEEYETTDYTVHGRVRNLDEVCGMLGTLKTDESVHFRSFSESTNNCSATFYVHEDEAETTRAKLAEIPGIDISRVTESVTRRRSVLKDQTMILREQLTSVEQTLIEAERQYDEITDVARASSDASALTEAIRDKLSMVDMLTQRRIQLTSQLQNTEQQAMDLDERIGHVGFYVYLTRTYAIDTERTARQWEAAWQLLKEEFTAVLIGFSAYLGVFILRALQFAFYGLILIAFARFLWKIVRVIWRW